MVQIWLLWWPKNTTTTVKPHSSVTTSTATTMTMPVPENGSCCCISSSSSSISSSSSSSSTTTRCSTTSSSCLSKLVRKLKKHCRSLRAAAVGSRQSSFQCRYDPLSYSLNFDTSGCGNLLEDEEYYYYQFCAFSSRYVANPKTSSSPKMLPASH